MAFHANSHAQSSSERPVDLGVRLDIFLTLQVIGLIGSVVVLFTAPFSSISRQVTWYNFFISWTVFCISYLLLFFAGQGHSREPPFALCLVQSSMTYAASPFAASATLGMVIQLYFNICISLTGTRVKRERVWDGIIRVLPYIVFFGVLVISLIVGLALEDAHFSTISYCSLETVVPGRLTAALVVFFLVPVLVLNGIRLPRAQRSSFTLKTNSSDHLSEAVQPFFCVVHDQGIQINVHSCDSILTLRSDIGCDSDDGLADLDIVMACIPNAAVLIFGTHKDLLQVWMFWKRKKTSKQFLE
ncbi:hypothetical protein K435DRAFT_871391 [Dendrothele bispora CBS 962.96]|uniref:Uncharacterized protein n=1 Tax=Dendrothele bispora (strain CBS 962.96) TaxID=1314807 RepID=A0A4S8L4M3_DENBC|nr:hypothetical protein K435DRAFT_871391 [Dendrothele bispora CBS 962.96]